MENSVKEKINLDSVTTEELRGILKKLLLINAKVNDYKLLGIRNHEVVCVDRNNRIVTFVRPEDISEYLQLALKNWILDYPKAKTPEEIVFAITQLWVSLITIHPFADGNGRTIKEFIRQELQRKSLDISGFTLLDQVLLTGNLAEEIPQIESAFFLSIFENDILTIKKG